MKRCELYSPIVENGETDREKRSRVLLQTMRELAIQGHSAGTISMILKESYAAVHKRITRLRKLENIKKSRNQRPTNLIDLERNAVVDLRNNGLSFKVIAALLNISYTTVASRITEGKIKGVVMVRRLKGAFQTREERMKYNTFFIRLGMTSIHIAGLLDIDVSDILNDYTELKKRIGKAYRSWEYPLQQCYDVYRSFLGYEVSFDDIPDLTDDMRLRASEILQSIVSEKILTFLENEGSLPSDKEFCDPFDRIGRDVYGSEDGHWRTARELWNAAYQGLWECIQKEYGILPNSPDGLLRLIDTMYQHKIHAYNASMKKRRTLLREALARISKKSQRVMQMYYGLETGNGVPIKEIMRIWNFTQQRFSQIRKRLFQEIRNPRITNNPVMEKADAETLPLAVLGLSRSMIVRFEKRGIEVLGDFRKKSEADLCMIPYIGPISVKNLEMKLWRFGIRLVK